MTCSRNRSRSKTKIRTKIKSKKPDAAGFDPFITLEPVIGGKSAAFSADDSRLKFECELHEPASIIGESDPKNSPSRFRPHLEVVYHFSVTRTHHPLIVKLILPVENNQPGQIPEVPTRLCRRRPAATARREVFDPGAAC